MATHKEMMEKWKKDPGFMVEYDALEDEFELLEELLKARRQTNMTQDMHFGHSS